MDVSDLVCLWEVVEWKTIETNGCRKTLFVKKQVLIVLCTKLFAWRTICLKMINIVNNPNDDF